MHTKRRVLLPAFVPLHELHWCVYELHGCGYARRFGGSLPTRASHYGVCVNAAFLDAPLPLAMAHRGGAKVPQNEAIENTLEAFACAVGLGYRYIETDVQVSRDGEVYIFHDDETDRLLGRPGPFIALSDDEIAAVRVGERVRVPTLREALIRFPEVRFNIDLKHPQTIEPTIRVVRESGAENRCLFASFSHQTLATARRMAPDIATSMSPQEVAALRLGPLRRIRAHATAGRAVAAQVPARRGPVTVVHERFISAAHDLGVQVHVWTVDEPEEIRRLLDLGVDGIVTDRPDLLKDELVARGQWRNP